MSVGIRLPEMKTSRLGLFVHDTPGVRPARQGKFGSKLFDFVVACLGLRSESAPGHQLVGEEEADPKDARGLVLYLAEGLLPNSLP